MKINLSKLIRKILSWVLGLYSDEQFVDILVRLVSSRVDSRSPEQALKFLFSLDALLYRTQSRMAIAYGDGVHTKHRHMHYHDFFINKIDQNDRVLDIGCGIGVVAFDVAERTDAHVVGIDINEENIQIACERYHHQNLQFRVGDALKSLPEEKFSTVILSNVLEHLPGRSDFLRRVQQTIAPRHILIRVPLFERDWRVPLKKELGVEWRLDPTHETEYTLESFDEELRQAGLTKNYLEVRWGEIWAEVSAVK